MHCGPHLDVNEGLKKDFDVQDDGKANVDRGCYLSPIKWDSEWGCEIRMSQTTFCFEKRSMSMQNRGPMFELSPHGIETVPLHKSFGKSL